MQHLQRWFWRRWDEHSLTLELPGSRRGKRTDSHSQLVWVLKSGKPLRGLIQDSIVSGVYITSKDTFLKKEQYNQLFYIGLHELIEMDKIWKIETFHSAHDPEAKSSVDI